MCKPCPEIDAGNLTSWHDLCSDGGLLIMGKAAQEKAKFRWYDTTRYEVSNKVSKAERARELRLLICYDVTAALPVPQQPCIRTSSVCAWGTESCLTCLEFCKRQQCIKSSPKSCESASALSHLPFSKGTRASIFLRLAISHVHGLARANSAGLI